jgi:hypothetical protein
LPLSLSLQQRHGDGEIDIVRVAVRNLQYGFPVAGSRLSKYFPPAGSTNWPSIKFLICADSVRI